MKIKMMLMMVANLIILMILTSGVNHMKPPVPIIPRLVSSMVELRVVVGPREVDDKHVAGHPVVEEPEPCTAPQVSSPPGQEGQLARGQKVLWQESLVSLVVGVGQVVGRRRGTLVIR